MADLKTSYMGIQLSSPVIVGACSLSKTVENIKKAEDAGAGAIVIRSLFQEQIELEAQELDEVLDYESEQFPEALTYFPKMESSGPREHVMWVEKTKKAVGFPVFGSLNATRMGNWVNYAEQLEDAGVDGLELNLYSIETDPARNCDDIEKRSLDVVAGVKSAVKIPVAVKLSPWYTSVANFASRVVGAGADALVLFNRFYQPDIDPDEEAVRVSLDLSRPEDTRLPLRWVAVLSESVGVDLAASSGVHSGRDVVKHLLAGAKAAQCAAALYKNGIDHISSMNREISEWMDARGYRTIEDFRGKLSQTKVSDPTAYERSQYVRLLFAQD